MLRIVPHVDREPVAQAKRVCLKVRKGRNLTQGQLAQKLGVKRKTIENIEQERYDTVPRSLLLALLKLAEEKGEEERGESD